MTATESFYLDLFRGQPRALTSRALVDVGLFRSVRGATRWCRRYGVRGQLGARDLLWDRYSLQAVLIHRAQSHRRRTHTVVKTLDGSRLEESPCSSC